MIGVAEFG